MDRYRQGASVANACAAQSSALLTLLDDPKGHYDVKLSDDDRERLITWMDVYAQRLGSFDEQQEKELVELRRRSAPMLIERE
jgi:hypothetical protein